MKKIFISHPFISDPINNKIKVDKICKELKDVLPISPLHLFSFIEEETPQLRAEILQFCFQLIYLCDEVWVYGKSEGTTQECIFATTIGKKVVKKY